MSRKFAILLLLSGLIFITGCDSQIAGAIPFLATPVPTATATPIPTPTPLPTPTPVPPNPKIISEQLETYTDRKPTGNDFVAVVRLTIRNDGGPGNILVSAEVTQQNVGRWVKEDGGHMDSGEIVEVDLDVPEVEFTQYGLGIISGLLGRGSSGGAITYKASVRAVR